MEMNFDRACFGAGAAKRTGIGKMFPILQPAQMRCYHRTDRAGIGRPIGMAADVAENGAYIEASAATDAQLKAEILTYSRSKGLFAGLALDGAALTMDDGANKKVYGKAVTGEDILLERQVHVNSIVKPFVDALAKYSPAPAKATRAE